MPTSLYSIGIYNEAWVSTLYKLTNSVKFLDISFVTQKLTNLTVLLTKKETGKVLNVGYNSFNFCEKLA